MVLAAWLSQFRRCREAGIEEFILKPFRVEDLKRVMSVSASYKGVGQSLTQLLRTCRSAC